MAQQTRSSGKHSITWYLTNTIIRPMTYELLFREIFGNHGIPLLLRSFCIGDDEIYYPYLISVQSPYLEKQYIIDNAQDFDMTVDQKNALLHEQIEHYRVCDGYVDISLFRIIKPVMNKMITSPSRVKIEINLEALDDFVDFMGLELDREYKLWDKKNLIIAIISSTSSFYLLKPELQSPVPIHINLGNIRYYTRVTVGQTPALKKNAQEKIVWNTTCMCFICQYLVLFVTMI